MARHSLEKVQKNHLRTQIVVLITVRTLHQRAAAVLAGALKEQVILLVAMVRAALWSYLNICR